MKINIRKATEKDLETLYQFEQGVVETERPFDSTLRKGLIHYYDLKRLIDSPTAQLMVAETDKQIIASGYVRIDEAKDYLAHTQQAYFGFMYVLPEFRGQGVNKKIMDELKAWARSQGVAELRLEVYIENTSAIRAYEKLGFARHMLEMRMNLNDQQS